MYSKIKIKFTKKIDTFKLLFFPYLTVLLFLILLPFLIILIFAFTEFTANNLIRFSFENVLNILNNSSIMKILGFSIFIGLLTAFLCLIIGYPIAYIIAFKIQNQKSKAFLWFLFTFPIWINLLIKSYGIQTLFRLLFPDFYGTFSCMLFGLINVFLPIMIMNIYTSLDGIDRRYLDASSDLGAKPSTTIKKIIFPLSLSGVFSGLMLVFISASTTLVIPHFLGNGNYLMISNVIENYFFKSSDYKSAISVALILLLSIVVFILLFKFAGKIFNYQRPKKGRKNV
ncbi:ABC transporter permease [symbiont of Argiope bruennichi]|uniref:ABC transporter permease n=1 Tax=symbiont of Argiope bruennichi TaxID=2810479 RepID=UPI003DA4B270